MPLESLCITVGSRRLNNDDLSKVKTYPRACYENGNDSTGMSKLTTSKFQAYWAKALSLIVKLVEPSLSNFTAQPCLAQATKVHISKAKVDETLPSPFYFR